MWVLKILPVQNYWLFWSAAVCPRLPPSTWSLIKECQQCTHLVRHHAGAWVCVRVTACTVLLRLTFTIVEDPLTPSLPERPLVSVNYPQYLQLPAHQVSAPIWSSRRQQAGRQGRGKCWIPVGHWLHKLLLMREVLSKRAASSNDHNGGSGWQMQPQSKGDLIKHTYTSTPVHMQGHMHIHTCT